MRCKPGQDFLPYDRPIAVSKSGSTSDAPLDQAPKRFDIVGMDLAAYPFVARVRDRFMLDVAAKIVVILIFVGHYQRHFLIDHLAHESRQSGRILTADHARHDIALALNRSDDA